MLASSIALLSQCDLAQSNSLLLVEQVLYLSQGDSYIQELNISEEPPASPSSVPLHFWHSLHKVPLSVEYFSKVVKSIHDDTDFWEKMTHAHLEEDSSQTEKETNVLDLSKFPWQAEKSDSPHCLDDYVLLMCINPKVAHENLLSLVPPLMESVSVPLLSVVLKRESNTTTPLLLVHNESCPISQSNMLHLESELRTIHQVYYLA